MIEKELRRRALEILEMEDAEEGLAELVRWLDLEIYGEGKREELAHQIFMLALIALGDLVLGVRHSQARPAIQRTIFAAEECFANPGGARLDGLFSEATKTYPFGPGEGCYAIPATGVEGCGPGSGCRTGVGTLACQGIPARQIMDHFRKELVPWLEEERPEL
ncbi:MAG: hypothetical protein AAF725_03755 [Acidobacteriota bacterium]